MVLLNRRGYRCLAMLLLALVAPFAAAGQTVVAEAIDNAEPLVGAAKRGDFEEIEALLDDGCDVNRPLASGLTAWNAARLAGHVELADLLANRGADTSVAMPDLAALAKQLGDESVQPDSPGVAFLVSRNGEILVEVGFGLADVSRATAITPATQFRIGSVTKQFTAAAILRLQELGKLSVTDRLDKYLPDMPHSDQITLHHLLTHTSGLHSYTARPDFAFRVMFPVKTDALLKLIQEDACDFEPGQKWSYCNSGYFILGRIVELASQQSYGDFLKSQFFAPLAMQATGVYSRAAAPPHDSKGYSYRDGKYHNAKNWDMSWAGGAGALYSTVGDLQKWNAGLFEGRILTDGSRQAAWTPEKLADGSSTSYGYGWAMGSTRGLKTISHNGGLDGYQSHLSRFPDQKLTVVVLVNASPSAPALQPGRIATELAQAALWEEMQPQPARRVAQVDVAALDAYLGADDYGQSVLTVTREDDQLYAQLSGQDRFAIFPLDETHFFYKVVDAQIDFALDDQGHVTHVTHHQGGRTFDAARLPDEDTLQLTAAELDAFVGVYQYPGLGRLTVSREGEQLFAQMTGQPKFKVFPVSDDSFEWRVVQAHIKFARNDAGHVIGGTHFQGGGELAVTRVAE